MNERDDDGRGLSGPGRHRWIAIGLAVAAVAAAVAIAVSSATTAPTQPAATSASTGTTAATSTTSAPPAAVPKSPTPEDTGEPRSEAGPEAQQEVAAVAAGLPAVSLTSPAEWDQWLPEGKPFPGADLADDISTCPVLSARLEAVTGQKMSYWTGTLPGPGGCAWVETPLDYDTPDYDYVVNVGFLADGSTDWFPIGSCARRDVPSVADDAVLARCTWQGMTTYVLAVPDTRLTQGLWVLQVQTKAGAAVPASEVVPALVDGVVAAFG
jgi:hypothetical protein